MDKQTKTIRQTIHELKNNFYRKILSSYLKFYKVHYLNTLKKFN